MELIDNKIQELINNKETTYNELLSIFTNELNNKGKVSATTMIEIDVLFHSLEQGFELPNINLELYKKLKHLLNTTTIYPTVIYPNINGTGIITSNLPSITLSTNTIDFGTVDFDSTVTSQSVTITGTNLTSGILLTAPSNFSISFDPSIGFKQSIFLYPTVVSGVTNSTIWIKPNNNVEGTFNEQLEVSCYDVITQYIDLSLVSVHDLYVTPVTYITLDSSASTFTAALYSLSAWSLSTDTSTWIDSNIVSGSGGVYGNSEHIKNLTISVEANIGVRRTGIIGFENINKKVILTITQPGI